MSLGVLLHTANIYQPGILARLDVEEHWLFGALSNAIHVFRMPAFFWVAGYFCAMTLARSGPSGLLESRLPRLIVPLLTTLLT